MSSPIATSSTKRVTAVLPRSSKTAISVFISQCAKNGSLDAPTVLTLTSLMDDRQFAIDFKTQLGEIMAKQKETRTQKKLIKEQKKAVIENWKKISD